MSDAIARMVFHLIRSPGWKPDRGLSPGPYLKPPPMHREPRPKFFSPAMKAKVLGALEAGPATGEEVAMRTKCNIHSVHAKLSRLHHDGVIKRTKSAISPQTGRMVQVYELK
jgi:predicted Rossmann fold nucleotide-binding protein DprA/Smf involved in DNA uptake